MNAKVNKIEKIVNLIWAWGVTTLIGLVLFVMVF